MTFREYIRQMDEEELCCMFCPFSYDDDSCVVDSEHCPLVVRNLLDCDVQDPVFDGFFCR